MPASRRRCFDFHEVWGYVAIGANAIAGVIALVAWRVRSRRAAGGVWIVTIVAEVALMLQVLVGTILVVSKDYVAPRFHMFYGFVAFLTVGLAYQYRRQMRGRREMFYGLVGLFLMGLGIRAARRRLTRWPRQRRVLLLFGGRSAEHDVSRVTAVAVARALDPERYESCRSPSPPTAAGCSPTRRSARSTRAPTRCRARSRSTASPPRASASWSPIRRATCRSPRATFDVDVVLPLLHGPYGEDGTVQGSARARRPARTSARACVGSAVGDGQGDDEARVRRRAGFPTPRHRSSSATGTTVAAFARRRRARARLPVLREAGQPRVVGRRVEGVRPRRARRRVRRSRSTYDEWILVEEAVTGREIELAVLGDDPPAVSVPGEIVPGDDFYSYADKYEADDAELLAPAPLTDDADRGGAGARGAARSRRAAARRWPGSTCSSRSRADGFLVNEVNTIPGFTPISMYPRLWEVSGVPYPELLDRLIDLAHRPPRPPRRPRRPPAVTDARDSEVDDGAGEGAGDAVDLLDLRDDELAEVVEGRRSVCTITS